MGKDRIYVDEESLAKTDVLMRRVSILGLNTASTAVIAALLLAGCSSGYFAGGKPGSLVARPLRYSSYNCPSTGTLKYVSDFYNNYINVYHGNFPLRAPCGYIGLGYVSAPQGLYVDPNTHDLYVATLDGVVVFHRGQTTPYNTYGDPSGHAATDVTVANDGTIIASNGASPGNFQEGSLSTWTSGPSGKFIGNFPYSSGGAGGYITKDPSGEIYFDDMETNSRGALWTVSCPTGACGVQTRVPGVTLGYPGGIAFDNSGDLLAMTTNSNRNAVADVFELPNAKPKSIAIIGGLALGVAFGARDNQFYVAEFYGFNNSFANQYSYPSGTLVGRQEGNLNGGFVGVAIDP